MTGNEVVKDGICYMYTHTCPTRVHVQNGRVVKISSPRNTITMKANVTDTILAGVVSVPHHWPGEANVNALVDDKNLDPISGFLPCKSFLCQVVKG